MLECWDFSWSGESVNAGFFLSEDKLELIIIRVPWVKASATVEALAEKYGPPSSGSSPEAFEQAGTPGNDASVCFAADTVCAAIGWNGGTAMFALHYKAPNLRARMRDKIAPDL